MPISHGVVKMNRQYIKNGTIFQAIGAAGIAIYSVRPSIDDFLLLPEPLYQALMWSSISLIILGFITILIGSFFVSVPFLFSDTYYCPIPAKTDDLNVIHSIAKKAFGPNVDIASVQTMGNWFSKNSNSFTLISSCTDTRGTDPEIPTVKKKICGYYILLPLDRKTGDEMMEDKLKAVDLRSEDILEKGKSPNTIYIAGIAVDKDARGCATGSLSERMRIEIDRGAKRFMARAATKAGLKMLRRFRFRPASGGAHGLNQIYVASTDNLRNYFSQ